MQYFGSFTTWYMALVAILFYESTEAYRRSNSEHSTTEHGSTSCQESSSSYYPTQYGSYHSSGSHSSSSRGLPSLGGLTQGLGLGHRNHRSLTGKKFMDKDSSKCNCQTQYDPVCASNGKTYPNQCIFQCEMRSKSSSSEIDKISKRVKNPSSLKIVKKGMCTGFSTTTDKVLHSAMETTTIKTAE